MITMDTPNWHKLGAVYCKAHGKWGVYINLHYDTCNDTWESFNTAVKSDLPIWVDYWDSIEKVLETAINEYPAIFLTDTEEEMWSIYRQVRGGDGLPNDPTPGRFYACTYNPQGNLLTENT